MSYSDSSQIVTLFTKHSGLVTILAKGAFRPPRRHSSFPAPFDLAGWYDLVYRSGGGELHLGLEARLLEGFDLLRRALPSYLDACLALEVLSRAFSPLDPHPELLRGALSYLKMLEAGAGRQALRVHFYALVLRESGVAPEWRRCVECGRAPAGSSLGVRAPLGVVCSRCERGGEERVDAGVIRYLAAEAEASWGRVPELAPDRKLLDGAWRLLEHALLEHLETSLRSLRYLRD